MLIRCCTATPLLCRAHNQPATRPRTLCPRHPLVGALPPSPARPSQFSWSSIHFVVTIGLPLIFSLLTVLLIKDLLSVAWLLLLTASILATILMVAARDILGTQLSNPVYAGTHSTRARMRRMQQWGKSAALMARACCACRGCPCQLRVVRAQPTRSSLARSHARMLALIAPFGCAPSSLASLRTTLRRAGVLAVYLAQTDLILYLGIGGLAFCIVTYATKMVTQTPCVTHAVSHALVATRTERVCTPASLTLPPTATTATTGVLLHAPPFSVRPPVPRPPSWLAGAAAAPPKR